MIKSLKKNYIIIALILLIVLIITGICTININSNKKDKNNITNSTVKRVSDSVKQDNSKKQDSSDGKDEEKRTDDNSATNKDEKKENKVDNNKEITKSSNKASVKEEVKSSNNSNNNNVNESSNTTQPSNNVNNSNTNTNTTSNNTVVSTNTDEEDFNNFVNDYSTLLILGGTIDFYSESEQITESNKWVNLGYRTELPKACTYLSSGQRCVYSLFVYAGEGACGTRNSIKVDWRSRNYIDSRTYLESLGYSCG